MNGEWEKIRGRDFCSPFSLFLIYFSNLVIDVGKEMKLESEKFYTLV